jgi:ubiquitin-like modifier-activating enzyme ATG7
MLASALVAELFVALLQHPLKHHAPALVPMQLPAQNSNSSSGGGVGGGALRGVSGGASAAQIEELTHGMGWLPHQLRGFLESFDTKVITAHAFDRCTACSPRIIQV